MRSNISLMDTTMSSTTTDKMRNQELNDMVTWHWVSFTVQMLSGIFIISCMLWIICVNRGGAYFTKRSISDCHFHMILFGLLSILFGFCSMTAYLMFRQFYFEFGLYFGICGLYSLFMVAGLWVVKYRFQIRCRAMMKENQELGTPVTEREASDLCRIKDYYDRTRKSTNWQRPVFTREQLESWARYLAIADLTGEKQQALQQIVGEMRRGPLNWGPTYFQTSSHPNPIVNNLVPPAYAP